LKFIYVYIEINGLERSVPEYVTEEIIK